MTVHIVDVVDGKRLEMCDHIDTLELALEGKYVRCKECGCVWYNQSATAMFQPHMRIVEND